MLILNPNKYRKATWLNYWRHSVMVQKVEGRQLEPKLCRLTTRTLSINPAVNGYLFENREE